MPTPALDALLPVATLIAVGGLAARLGWVKASSLSDLSNLAFKVLAPALLFTSMSHVHLDQVALKPVGVYFMSIAVVFALVLLRHGGGVLGAVRALGATFSNTLIIGVPLVAKVYGQAGLVPLLSLLTVHTLVVLSTATVIIELMQAVAEQRRSHSGKLGLVTVMKPTLKAIKGSLLHPVPLPILAGLAVAASGVSLPEVVSEPIAWLGNAFAPVALVLLGITLGCGKPLGRMRVATELALSKIIVHPLVMLVMGLAMGLGGLELRVMVLTAALPIGANVYLFAQRYQVAEQETTAAVALSTLAAAMTLTLVLTYLPLLP